MKKIVIVLALAIVSLLGLTAPAQAATTQSYCNSSNSAKSIRVGATTVKIGSCKTIGKNAIVHLGGGSYQVKYSGSYSGCRTNDNFDAANTPTKMTFLVYESNNCVDIVFN